MKKDTASQFLKLKIINSSNNADITHILIILLPLYASIIVLKDKIKKDSSLYV